MADLNLLKSVTNHNFHKCQPCQNHADLVTDYLDFEIFCIDNWAEVLEPPETTTGIVRACGDWQARLATFAVALAMKRHVVVLPSSICWECVRKATKEDINILIA